MCATGECGVCQGAGEYLNVYEVAAALGHDVCETCKEQVCTNPGHGGSCAYDSPGYEVDGLVFCQACGEAARLEDEPTQVEAIPLACDVEETTPIRYETIAELARKMDRRTDGVPEPRLRDRANWFWAFAVVVTGLYGLLVTPGCAYAPAAPAVEAVGELTVGPSVRSAPLAHDAPPALGFVGGSDDDAPGEVVTTETRADAPEVQAKGGGLAVGAVR